MLRSAIVDNEIDAIEELENMLNTTCPEVVVEGKFRQMNEAVKGLRLLHPDVVFLDVDLGDGLTGFDILEKIPDRRFEVIFVTAHDKYAVRAFHFSATHYLEKPVDEERLREAVDRVKMRRTENDFRLQLQVLSENLKSIAALPRQIILPNPRHGDSIVVPIQEVIRVEAKGSQAIFVIWWEKKIVQTMYSLNIGTLQKKMLQGYDDFIMIHESHIINRNHVTHYNAKSHAVQMADGTFINIAKRRITDFLEKFSR